MVKSNSFPTKGREEVFVPLPPHFLWGLQRSKGCKDVKVDQYGALLGGRMYFYPGQNSLFTDTIDNDNEINNNKNSHLLTMCYMQGIILITLYVATYLILKTTLWQSTIWPPFWGWVNWVILKLFSQDHTVSCRVGIVLSPETHSTCTDHPNTFLS